MSKTKQRKTSAFYQGKHDAAQGLPKRQIKKPFQSDYKRGRHHHDLEQKAIQQTPVIDGFEPI